MNALTHKLDQLEARLQDLIEGRLARLLPRQSALHELAEQLVKATQINAIPIDDGHSLAPSLFILQAPMVQALRLQENQL